MIDLGTNNKSKKGKQANMAGKKVQKGPKVLEAPVAFTQDEIDFYAISAAIIDMGEVLWKDASELVDSDAKRIQTEFMAYYAKLKAAFDLVKEGESVVRIGKDSQGNEWCFDENLFSTPERTSDFLLPYFLIWTTKKSMMMVLDEFADKAERRIKTLTNKVKNLEEANKTLATEKEEAEKKAKHFESAWKLAKTSGRLQSKRSRRVSVSAKR